MSERGKLLVRADAVVVADRFVENATIVVEGGMIVGVFDQNEADGRTDGRTIDLAGLTVYPGFIDVHNHGAVGVDVNEATAEGLVEIGRFLASRGVTAWLPTFVPDADDAYRRVVGEIEKVLAMQSALPIAQIVGLHYEGVFANEKMCGALRPEYFKIFTGGELNDLPTISGGAHLTTLAPEIEGGVALVAELSRRRWIPSIGHTRADTATLEAAFAAGARHVTHLFNAMTGVHHRELGVAGWALTTDDIFCEIIADGIHVHPEMLRFAQKNKPADRLLLVSDSVAPTGLGDGEYELWGERIAVTNGRTRNERGSIAGSVITMLDAVKMYLSLGVEPPRVAQMASTNPARLLGADAERGAIRAGLRADLAALDAEGEVRFCLIGGDVAFDRL